VTNEIIKAVSVALKNEFEPVDIYFSRDVKQGLEKPCFFIALVESATGRRIGRRYKQTNSLDVIYFPEVDGGNAEIMGVAGRLFKVLEFVELSGGDLVHGTDMNYSITDGLLHFLVDFNVFVRADYNPDEMETAETHVGVAEKG
jgi:hypothetical protein